MRSLLGVSLAAIAMLVAVAPATGGAPADGNGNQFVVVVDDALPVDCGAAGTIEVHAVGWFKGRTFQGTGNTNLELTVFHVVATYSNAAGDTFRYVDVGPDKASIDKDGNFVFTVTGRPAFTNGASLRGHWVFVVDPARQRPA